MRVPRWWIACAAALVTVYAAVFAVVGSAAFARAPDWIALGATFDLRRWSCGARMGLLVRRWRVDRIALTIDDPGAFIAAVAAGRGA